MSPQLLAQNNILVTQSDQTYHVHAIENPSFKITCFKADLDASVLRVAEQRGYERGRADCKREVVEKLFES